MIGELSRTGPAWSRYGILMMANLYFIMDSEIRPSETPSEAVKRIIACREECTPSQLGRLRQTVDREGSARFAPYQSRFDTAAIKSK